MNLRKQFSLDFLSRSATPDEEFALWWEKEVGGVPTPIARKCFMAGYKIRGDKERKSEQ